MSQPRVVVVGLGAMGAAAAFHLSRRGAAVIGLEARAPGHRQGASHGQSRIIRKAYYEDPCYVPLVLRAYDLWRELEQASGEPLLELTGGLMIGPPDGEVVAGSSASARQWGIYHRLLTAREIHHEFPQLAPERDDAGLFEPEAGALAPEAAVLAHLGQAAARGAQLHFGEPVEAWEPRGEELLVHSSAAQYRADRLVLAAGAWTPSLLAGLGLPLAVERQVQVWLAPPEIAPYQAPGLPIFLVERPAPGMTFYGLPSRDRLTVKVAQHHGGELCEVESLRRTVAADELSPLRDEVSRAVPGLAGAPVQRTQVCIYTNTPDYDFVIGAHPGAAGVVIAAGFSGHGFKFS